MADFDFRRLRIEQELDYEVLKTPYENGAQQKRLKNTTKVLGFKISTPPMTKTDAQTLIAFFNSKYGSLTSFTFTSPFDDITYNVQMSAPMRMTFESAYYQGEVELLVLSEVET